FDDLEHLGDAHERQRLEAVSAELRELDRVAGRQLDVGYDLLPEQRIGHTDDRDFLHTWMRTDDLLDLLRKDPLAGALDHLGAATDQEQMSGLVESTQVTGPQAPLCVDLTEHLLVAGHVALH